MLTRPQASRFATGECDLELSSKALGVRMTEHEFRRCLGVGNHIEDFGSADTGQRAGRDVANGVAAGFARRDADGGKAPHQRRRVVDVDKVKLKVLARGDVQHAVGIFLGEIGQRVHLIGVQSAKRNLDALHSGSIPESVGTFGQVRGVVQFLGTDSVVAMAVVVALAVGAAAQPGFGKDFFVQLALLAQLDFGFKNVDFFGELRIDTVCELLFPGRHPRIVSGLRHVVNPVRRAPRVRRSPFPLQPQ